MRLSPPQRPTDGRRGARARAPGAPRLVSGLVMLAAIGIAFVPPVALSAIQVLTAAGLMVGASLAYALLHVGRRESAYALFALVFTGLVTMAASATGGLSSFAAIWLILVPVEAARSGSRRIVGLAWLTALGAAVFLSLGNAPAPPVHEPKATALTVLSIVATLLYVVGLALGVQSRARDRSHVHAEEDRNRLLADNMADVITRHGRNGHVLFASRACDSVLAVKPQALHGRGLFDRVHVADRPAYLTALGDAASLREGRVAELRIGRDPTEPGSAGRFIWVEMRCWPLAAAQKAGVGDDCEVVAVLRDVTARKDEELALEDARAEAERASVAKSRFLATMSHELRTPLNAIIGFSEMLREEGTLMIDAKQRHDYAHLINESGHHLLSVVNGILDMSKIESGNFELMPEPVAVEKVIAECCELLALRARQAGIEIVVDLAASLPRIIADKRALLQIMLNLLSNAIKFTNRGGKVTIIARADTGRTTEREAARDMASREASRETAHIVVTVEDTGVGIGAQDLQRVGEPFFQARSSYDRRHDGTGLGVSIVKGLLALHGGRMEIESHVGEGTRIAIHLPIDCEHAPGERGAVLARVGPRTKDDARPDAAPDMPARARSETVVKKRA